jgi:translation initiation factor 2 subunit 2
VADPEVDLFAGMKKKKKKQVAMDLGDSVPAEEHVDTSAPAPEATESAPVPAGVETNATESLPEIASEPVADDGAELFGDLKKKKKKKKEIPLDLVSFANPLAYKGSLARGY